MQTSCDDAGVHGLQGQQQGVDSEKGLRCQDLISLNEQDMEHLSDLGVTSDEDLTLLELNEFPKEIKLIKRKKLLAIGTFLALGYTIQERTSILTIIKVAKAGVLASNSTSSTSRNTQNAHSQDDGTESDSLDTPFEDMNTVHVTPSEHGTEDEASNQQRGKRSAARGIVVNNPNRNKKRRRSTASTGTDLSCGQSIQEHTSIQTIPTVPTTPTRNTLTEEILHGRVTCPVYSIWEYGGWVKKYKQPHQQGTCKTKGCKRQTRLYCKCSMGRLRCTECLFHHMVDPVKYR